MRALFLAVCLTLGCRDMTIAAVTSWCIRGSFTPNGGHSWIPASADLLFELGPRNNIGPPYIVRCSVIPDAHSGSGIKCQIIYPGGAYSEATLTLGASVVPTPSVGSTHTIAVCYEAGVLTLFFDDVKIDYQTNYVGRALPLSMPSPTGGTVGAGFAVTSFTVTAAAFPNSGTLTRFDMLWLGDSIHLNPNELRDLSGRISGTKQATWSLASYGSNTMGNGFLEMSDSVYAYESNRWLQKNRWKPLSAYSFVAFNYMVNEVEVSIAAVNGKMTIPQYRRGYDKIVALASAAIPRTVMCSSMPQTNGGITAWVPAEPYITAETVLQPIATRYNVPFVDYWTIFQAKTADATYTVGQLMRDTIHPTQAVGDKGIVLMADSIETYLTAAVAPIAATPEIVGSVVSYLWGKPTAGVWSMTSLEQITNTYPGETCLYRVAQSPDQANVASASGAVLSFPSAKFEMLFVHGIGSGVNGTFDVVVDRGLAGEVRKSFLQSSGGNYPRSFFVGDGFTGGPHTVEVETTSALAVNIVGVSYVGVP